MAVRSRQLSAQFPGGALQPADVLAEQLLVEYGDAMSAAVQKAPLPTSSGAKATKKTGKAPKPAAKTAAKKPEAKSKGFLAWLFSL